MNAEFKIIQENAELVRTGVAKLVGVQLDYDEKSVEWLDGYIERNRKTFDEKMLANLINTFGSFLGECVRRNFGGDWTSDENSLGIAFDEKNIVYPLAKIEKHLRNGSEDSVLGFYKLIPVAFKNK